ncbi:MAG: hypothetical protein COY66_00700 [Candidatus Kerfeldbacteria bacterium CG_4_10_14_0_8_um_filter_42_10]|uniref:Type 4 fimbrial biogenesis protein PilX N-terminal domain-containing protein n=1 Tax=Candidatus Kerfeldbacteria bacterium CG_4_10_14_0_8_um_filter_42_10 TaxID=2014248 RepID=A0A2M7RKC0_9BACT|nr:MAG: hypothetical protein COY66_00700 [Candidatus Kerfeldbacteria bacterium CG_4_10_14_0_8_um_filter_42_10]
MGQQQLLLIVLSVIIVGIAVVGINMFNDQDAKDQAASNCDVLAADLQNLAVRAQQHYRRPTAMGGGGGSFALLTKNAEGIGYLTTQPVNENGSYSISAPGDSASVTIQGIGKFDADGNGTNCTVRIQVWPDSVSPSIVDR